MAKQKAKISERFTYSDYCKWSDDERWELIEGEAFAMSPAPGTLHQEILGKFHLQFGKYFERKECRVFFAPYDVLLPKGKEVNDKVDTVVQPDLAVICDSKKIEKQGCRGAPDLIVEILSPSSLGHDKLRKFNLYERHGVKEYWIVEPEGFVQMFAMGGKRRFLRGEVFDCTMKVTSVLFPELAVDLSRIFPPAPKVVKERPSHYTVSK